MPSINIRDLYKKITTETDGAGSLLDADFLDGHDSSYFAKTPTVSSRALNGNYTLLAEDDHYLLLDPNGQDREVTLTQSWTGHIINDSSGLNAITLKEGANVVCTLSAVTNIKSVLVWWDGVEYTIQQTSVFQTNTGYTQLPATYTVGSIYAAAPLDGVLAKVPAGQDYTIISLKGVAVDSGSLTLSVKLNNVAVTGLGAIAVTTTPQTITATSNNNAVEGDILSWEVSSASSPTGLRGSLYVVT